MMVCKDKRTPFYNVNNKEEIYLLNISYILVRVPKIQSFILYDRKYETI